MKNRTAENKIGTIIKEDTETCGLFQIYMGEEVICPVIQ